MATCAQCPAELARKRFPCGRLEDRKRFEDRRHCSRRCMALSMLKAAPTRSAMLKRVEHLRKPTCERCGARKRLSTNHRNRDWWDNRPTNLATLCAQCHTRLHHEAGEIKPRQHPKPCRVCGANSARAGLCGLHRQRMRKHGDPHLTMRNVGGSWVLVYESSHCASTEIGMTESTPSETVSSRRPPPTPSRPSGIDSTAQLSLLGDDGFTKSSR